MLWSLCHNLWRYVCCCLQIKNYVRMLQVSQNWIPCEKFTPQLHNALSNENVKWYFHDTSYDGWPIVCCHPEQLCLLSRLRFVTPQSECSSWVPFDLVTEIWLDICWQLMSLWVWLVLWYSLCLHMIGALSAVTIPCLTLPYALLMMVMCMLQCIRSMTRTGLPT